MTYDRYGVSCVQKMLEVLLYIADIVLVLVLGVLARQLRRAVTRQTAPSYQSKLGHDVDLPSVTVCIPARNEHHALADCLQRVLASTYEKLEVIVLDDVSGDNTSALIKSFASEGVRFVQGSALPKGWLGKNHALQGLLEEASGRYVLFIDVDTVLAPNAIEHMVRYTLSHKAAMLSVLPRREDGLRASVVASPLRYFWELVFNRRLSPASSSHAWIIRRDILLQRFDGFKAFRNTVQPEAKIAAELAQTRQYKFLIGTQAFGVGYEKKWRSQLLSSVRLLYPALGKQRSLAILAGLDLLLLLIPFFVVILALLGAEVSVMLLLVNVAVAASYSVLYGYFARTVWAKGWVLGAVLWPLIVLQEIALVFTSAVQHERRTVKWKGRLIQPEVQS